ncbi:MAG: acyltransferase [Acidimicrobiales bacterium]
MSAVADTSADRSFVSVAPRLGFVGGFDGLRGIGVVIVLFGHIFPDGTDSFNPIVDVFFVISAFLIVSLLMQERRQNGRIDLRRFYTRRALRLLPNSYACMAAWMLIYGLVKVSGLTGQRDAMEQVNAIPGNVLAAATYMYHLVYPIGGTSGPLVQFWSLSLEEQFYFFIGFAVVGVLAFRRRVWVAVAAMAALIVWISWSRWRVDLGPWPGQEYSLHGWNRGLKLLWMARPDALLVGVLLAIGNARLPDPLTPRARRVIVATGTAGAVLCCLVLVSSLEILHKRGFPLWVPGIPREAGQVINRDGRMWCSLGKGLAHHPCTDQLWVFRWGFTAMAIGIAPLTLCLARCKDAAVSRFLSLRWFRKVGEMSYSLYVWHLLAFVLVAIVTDGMGTGPVVVAKLAAAFGISWLAHRYIDRAVLGMKLRFSSEKMVLDRRTGREVDSSSFTDRDKG